MTRRGSRADRMLSPIVDDVSARAAITGIVALVHGNALDFSSKSAFNKMPIGLMTRHISAGQQVWHARGNRQSLACVEQAKVILLGRRSVANRTKFNEAVACAGLAAGPIVADRKCYNVAAVFYQNRIAHSLRVGR